MSVSSTQQSGGSGGKQNPWRLIQIPYPKNPIFHRNISLASNRSQSGSNIMIQAQTPSQPQISQISQPTIQPQPATISTSNIQTTAIQQQKQKPSTQQSQITIQQPRTTQQQQQPSQQLFASYNLLTKNLQQQQQQFQQQQRLQQQQQRLNQQRIMEQQRQQQLQQQRIEQQKRIQQQQRILQQQQQQQQRQQQQQINRGGYQSNYPANYVNIRQQQNYNKRGGYNYRGRGRGGGYRGRTKYSYNNKYNYNDQYYYDNRSGSAGSRGGYYDNKKSSNVKVTLRNVSNNNKIIDYNYNNPLYYQASSLNFNDNQNNNGYFNPNYSTYFTDVKGLYVPTDDTIVPEGPYYALKVSCIANGYKHTDRLVAHIVLCDYQRTRHVNSYVKPPDNAKITSYLTPITGLEKKNLVNGMTLKMAKSILSKKLPKNAVIVGQNIDNDLDWLKLKKGVDYRESFDLRNVWRTWSEKFNSWTAYSLQHQAHCILNIGLDKYTHNACFDADIAMKLFSTYLHYKTYNPTLIERYKLTLKSMEQPASFSRRNPEWDKVCMGNKNTCQCGAETGTYNDKKVKLDPKEIQERLKKLFLPFIKKEEEAREKEKKEKIEKAKTVTSGSRSPEIMSMSSAGDDDDDDDSKEEFKADI